MPPLWRVFRNFVQPLKDESQTGDKFVIYMLNMSKYV